MTNGIWQSHGYDFDNINVYAKLYQNIPFGWRVMGNFRKLTTDGHTTSQKHRGRTHKAIIGYTPKVDIDFLRVVQLTHLWLESLHGKRPIKCLVLLLTVVMFIFLYGSVTPYTGYLHLCVCVCVCDLCKSLSVFSSSCCRWKPWFISLSFFSSSCCRWKPWFISLSVFSSSCCRWKPWFISLSVFLAILLNYCTPLLFSLKVCNRFNRQKTKTRQWQDKILKVSSQLSLVRQYQWRNKIIFIPSNKWENLKNVLFYRQQIHVAYTTNFCGVRIFRKFTLTMNCNYAVTLDDIVRVTVRLVTASLRSVLVALHVRCVLVPIWFDCVTASINTVHLITKLNTLRRETVIEP